MEHLINELKIALENRLYIMALNTALIIPDICSALESESGKTNGKKYMSWVDKYLAPKYNGFVNGEDIYKVRCAALHQGKLINDKEPKFQRILFQIPDQSNNVLHNNILNDALNLNIEVFIKDIIEGFQEWKREKGNDAIVQKNSENSLNFYPTGIKPYMVGVPLIS